MSEIKLRNKKSLYLSVFLLEYFLKLICFVSAMEYDWLKIKLAVHENSKIIRFFISVLSINFF